MKRMFFAVLLSLTPALAGAQGREACRADAAALCPKAAQGPERMNCLEAHQEKLSAACKEHLARERAEGEAFRADCKADIGGVCLNLQGHGLLECLAAQGDRLSKSCGDRIAAMRGAHRAEHEKISVECKDDAQKLCAGVGSGGVGTCLKANAAKLSAACRGTIK